MNAEELLGMSLAEQQDAAPKVQVQAVQVQTQQKRERLSAIVAGVGSRQYLGREVQLSDIDQMSAEEIDKLYCRYEARLGATMTKTLGNSFIDLYVVAVSRYFNVANKPKLIEELEEDRFINHSLTSVCCELFYRYGMYVAPFTAILTTARHIDFNKFIDSKNIADKMETSQTQNLELAHVQAAQADAPSVQPQEAEPKVQVHQKKKEKNPRRVAAGKKGTEVRWRASTPSVQAAPPVQVTAERKPACSHGDTLTTVVYKNYIPLCTVIAVGINIYLFFNRSVYAAPKVHPAALQNILQSAVQSAMQPAMQPAVQPALKVQAKQVDPLIMN